MTIGMTWMAGLLLLTVCWSGLVLFVGMKLAGWHYDRERKAQAQAFEAQREAQAANQELVSKIVTGHDNLTYAAALAIKDVATRGSEPRPMSPAATPEEWKDSMSVAKDLGEWLGRETEVETDGG